jgi:predicted alpha/beta superfamily hydrolase
MKKLLLLYFALLTHTLHGQLKDLPILTDTLYSTALNEKRALEIVLPTGYPKPDTKYDVLYVTDGEWNTKIVRDIHQFLELQFIPPCIIVSIPNRYVDNVNLRGRDYTPTHTEWLPQSGGASKYLSFLKNELVPYIDKKYPASGMNILYGSSLGGLFGLYAFLKEPQLFDSYMLSDPAFSWDDFYIRKLLSTKLDSVKTLHKSLLIAGRTGEAYKYMGIAAIDSVLRARLPEGLRWKTKLYDNETHNSMMFMTVYDGLKHTYDGYSNEALQFFPANGIIIEGKPVQIHAGGERFKNIGYTIDGTEPSPSSPRVKDDVFTISSPGELNVKAFCNVDRYNQKATGNFKAGSAPAPGVKVKKAKAGGWHYTYYEGSWSRLPDFKKLKPARSGFAGKDFSIAKLPRQKNFACLLEGQIEIKEDGYYVFGLDCDAKLFVANQLIIDYDGLHTVNNYQSYVLPLKKGFYPIRLEYFEKEGNAALQLIYLTPGADDARPIPAEVQYGY